MCGPVCHLFSLKGYNEASTSKKKFRAVCSCYVCPPPLLFYNSLSLYKKKKHLSFTLHAFPQPLSVTIFHSLPPPPLHISHLGGHAIDHGMDTHGCSPCIKVKSVSQSVNQSVSCSVRWSFNQSHKVSVMSVSMTDSVSQAVFQCNSEVLVIVWLETKAYNVNGETIILFHKAV